MRKEITELDRILDLLIEDEKKEILSKPNITHKVNIEDGNRTIVSLFIGRNRQERRRATFGKSFIRRLIDINEKRERTRLNRKK